MRKVVDPNAKISATERRFAILVFQGVNYADAYRRAGFDIEGRPAQSVANCAAILAKQPRIQKELDRLEKAQVEIADREQEIAVRSAAELWSREDSVRSLAELARLGMSAARQTQMKRDGTEVETLNVQAGKLAIDAIQQLNAMNGYDKAVGEDVPTIRVVLDEVEKYTV